eukprot:11577479-Alexandrium_andersonii.AAC.1
MTGPPGPTTNVERAATSRAASRHNMRSLVSLSCSLAMPPVHCKCLSRTSERANALREVTGVRGSGNPPCRR